MDGFFHDPSARESPPRVVAADAGYLDPYPLSCIDASLYKHFFKYCSFLFVFTPIVLSTTLLCQS
jgi:hypothetical protein